MQTWTCLTFLLIFRKKGKQLRTTWKNIEEQQFPVAEKDRPVKPKMELRKNEKVVRSGGSEISN
jgi:hypothetical protein